MLFSLSPFTNTSTQIHTAAALAKDASAAEQQAAGAPVRLPHARRTAELAWGQYLLTLTAALQRPVETLAGAMRCVEGPGPRDPGDCQQLASPAQLELAQSIETLPLEPFQRAYEVCVSCGWAGWVSMHVGIEGLDYLEGG